MTATASREALADDLKRRRAVQELEKTRLLRSVVNASRGGLSQREIADKLGVTQPVVQRMLVKAKHAPHSVDPSPREVILECAAGERTHADMMRELIGWKYTYGDFPGDQGAAPDYFVPGTWNQVEAATTDDLLSLDDYAIVREQRTHKAKKPRAAKS
jgi:hypothetical protein